MVYVGIALFHSFLTSQSNIALDFFNGTFFLVSFVVLLVSVLRVSSGGAEEGHIKYELSDGGSPRHLNTFSNSTVLLLLFLLCP